VRAPRLTGFYFTFCKYLKVVRVCAKITDSVVYQDWPEGGARVRQDY
jgi:hypothetical protein